jgi:hypothetical protein
MYFISEGEGAELSEDKNRRAGALNDVKLLEQKVGVTEGTYLRWITFSSRGFAWVDFLPTFAMIRG